ncbi:MAG: AmmeMemoRadiSam system protein B [Armatimonadota bacterium]
MSGRASRMLLAALLCAGMLCGCRDTSPGPQTAAETVGGQAAAARTVREPAVAGAFYPGDPEELAATVGELLAQAQRAELPGRVVALMVPHAGYVYSAGVAAVAYAQIEGQHFDTVVLVGPSHRVPVRGLVMPEADAWRTPLGEVPIDTEMRSALLAASDLFAASDYAHRDEHCLEVQLPFLQTLLQDFALVPLVAQDLSAEDCRSAGTAIAQAAANRSVLLVASTDMSHYPGYDEANRVDAAMLEAIASFDIAAIFAKDAELMGQGVRNLACTLCGLEPLAVVMAAAQALGADTAHVLKYANSGDVPGGDRTQCVGYGAVAFCGPRPAAAPAQPGAEAQPAGAAEEGELNAEQQARLLALAREAVAGCVGAGEVPDPPEGGVFSEKRAVFVTLHRDGMLRGCIGTLEAREALGRAVISAAIAAATQDPRFQPVRADEVDDLHVEISVLSPMRRVQSPEEIVVGKHGVLVRQGLRSGVFLPQVATEQGWDREELLRHLCAEKAGLPADAWQRGAQLYIFTAQVFAEQR